MKKSVLSLVVVGTAVVMTIGCGSDGATATTAGTSQNVDTLQGMVMVPAGDFIMGCDPAVDSACKFDEMPARRMYVAGFAIDEFEVTRSDFYRCVDAGVCTRPHDAFDPRVDWGGLEPGWEGSGKDYPVIGTTWDQAHAYCKWVGKRLPTEAEWEKAARGGCELYDNCETDSPINPWGNAPATCENAVLMTEAMELSCGHGGAQPIDVHPEGKSPYGAWNMIGNASEWVDALYEPYPGADTTKFDPEALHLPVNKGACYGSLSSDLRIAARFTMRDAPNYDIAYTLETDSAMGFRCAVDLAE